MLKITLSLLFIYSSFAAISNNPTKSLSAIRNDIRSLRKSISSLEKSLAKKNITINSEIPAKIEIGKR